LGHAVSVAREHVGNEPFVVMLGDDIMHERVGVLDHMLEVFERRGGSVVALKEVERHEIRFYGCATPERLDDNLVRILDIVEKPAVESAPSNLAVMGRYVFPPSIFGALDQVQPGQGGEIQLTDAIKVLLGEEAVFGWTFKDGRFDVGNKLDYLRATVELALEREDLGPGFRAFLAEVVRREGLA
jgi:UTP--glucose-1-phosphate uridylyltransferase